MNEYILKVMVWLNNPNFYSKEVIEKNEDAAAAYAADADAAAAARAAAAAAADAACWVDKYFERSGEDREAYEYEVKVRLQVNDKPMIIEMNGKKYKLVEVKND